MGLGYQYQNLIQLIGSAGGAVTVTSAFADNLSRVTPIGGASKVTLYVSYTLANGETNNNIDIRVETSHDASLLYQLVNESVVGAISTLTQREFTFQGTTSVATSYNLALPLDISDEFIRVAIKETGPSPSYGTAHVYLLISGDR